MGSRSNAARTRPAARADSGASSQADRMEGRMEEQDRKDKYRSSDEVALELTKFIASSTGYGKGVQAVGFGGKGGRTPEEQAESLLELFSRCRKLVREQ